MSQITMSQINMSQASASLLPVAGLFERAIQGLAKSDAAAVAEVLADCSRAQAPDSLEEFSRALAQKVVLEKVLEQTGRNLRVLCGEESSFRYGRSRGRNT